MKTAALILSLVYLIIKALPKISEFFERIFCIRETKEAAKLKNKLLERQVKLLGRWIESQYPASATKHHSVKGTAVSVLRRRKSA